MSAYEDRQLLWSFLKGNRRLFILVKLLRDNFCRLLEEHTKGAERFAQFFVAWYRFCSLNSSSVAEKWKEIVSNDYTGKVTDLDARALVSSIGSAVYSCFQKQVSVLYIEYSCCINNVMYYVHRYHSCMIRGIQSSLMLYPLKWKLMMMLLFTACSDFLSSLVFVIESVQYLVICVKDVPSQQGLTF